MQAMRSGTPFVWYHNGRPLKDGLKSAGGLGTVRIQLEESKEQASWTSVTSRLEVLRADQADSGNYTCAPYRGRAASVSVFVSQGAVFFSLHSQKKWTRPSFCSRGFFCRFIRFSGRSP